MKKVKRKFKGIVGTITKAHLKKRTSPKPEKLPIAIISQRKAI